MKGDASMATADKPSVRNSGSGAVYLQVQFEALTGRKSPRQISEFGLVFKGETLKAKASVPVCPRAALLPGEIAPLDLIVQPPPGLPADDYVGTLRIIATSAPGLGQGRCRT
jgi:hypothetical protein